MEWNLIKSRFGRIGFVGLEKVRVKRKEKCGGYVLRDVAAMLKNVAAMLKNVAAMLKNVAAMLLLHLDQQQSQT